MPQSKTANRQIVLNSRPVGAPTPDNFRTESADVPTPGAVLLRTVWLSLDPYMRGRMSDAPSYAPPAELGQPMVGGTVSRSSRRTCRRSAKATGGRRRGLAGLCVVRWQRPDSARPRLRPSVVRARRARHAGLHRLYRPADDRRAEGRRNRGGRGGERCGRRGGRPDRQAEGLPRGRRRGRHRQVCVRDRYARFRRASTTAIRRSPRS